MPRQHHHQPLSLRKASITSIVCHFEDFWCSGKSSDLSDYSGQSDVLSPFQYLHDDMLQDIIDMLKRRKLLCPHHFPLLLHSNIRRLDLIGACAEHYHQIDLIKTVGIRCQKLTHLSLGGMYDDQPENLCAPMKNLPKILSVCLCFQSLDANVIKAISENCPNLQELDLTNCEITDKSLLYLCNYPEHPEARPKLRKLSIGGVHNLSKNTVVHLLKSQPSLQSIDTCRLLDHAFDQMHGEEFRTLKEVPSERVHNLLEITAEGSLEGHFSLGEADRLDLTFQCCPFLTTLTLWALMEGESLKNVVKLKHLKTLIVSMFRTDDFSTYMAPLLSEIGDNLTYLECVRFDLMLVLC